MRTRAGPFRLWRVLHPAMLSTVTMMACLSVGCTDSFEPRPTPTGPSSTVNVVSVSVRGPSGLSLGSAPVQLTALAVRSEGSQEDVTASATWTTATATILDVSPNGIVQARAEGDAQVSATSRSYISATAFAGDAAIVATEGRGVFAVANLRSARSASYFETFATAAPGDTLATLHAGNGTTMAWKRVWITAVDLSTNERRLLEDLTALLTLEKGDALGHPSDPRSSLCESSAQ